MRTLYIPNTPIHVTYRLYGSIPNLPLHHLNSQHRLQRLRLHETFRESGEALSSATIQDHRQQLLAADRRHYLQYDRLLDHPLGSPRYLESTASKEIIFDSWRVIAGQDKLKVYAISVMDNHVHILLESSSLGAKVSLPDTLERHKRYTATQLNRLHGTKGRRVWAEKEYSRTVRPGCFEQVLWYVLNNPVKAALTQAPLEWRGNWWAPELYAPFMAARVA